MMRTRLLPSLVAVTVALSPLTAMAQQAAAPSAVEDGKAHFQRGVALFHEGDFRGALVEFQRSYDLSHNHKVLYNIGQTDFELQDYAGARTAFQKYLAEGGSEIEASRRASVEEDIKKLAARVARVDVKANVEGAEVLVDDVVAGKTPLKDPILVSIGRRKITLQKGGVVSAARFVDVAGGDTATVSLELIEPKATPGPGPVAPLPPPVPVPPPAPPPSRTGMWVSLAITGALTAGAVATGVLALGAHSDAETKLGTLGVKASDVEAAHSKTATLALVTDILGGAAIAMAGVTIGLGVTSGAKKDVAQAGGRPGAPSDRAPKASLTIGPRGAVISGHF